MTKKLATVGWVWTTQVEVDETRLHDEDYLDSIRAEAVRNAWGNITMDDGLVTDCEQFPEISE